MVEIDVDNVMTGQLPMRRTDASYPVEECACSLAVCSKTCMNAIAIFPLRQRSTDELSPSTGIVGVTTLQVVYRKDRIQ